VSICTPAAWASAKHQAAALGYLCRNEGCSDLSFVLRAALALALAVATLGAPPASALEIRVSGNHLLNCRGKEVRLIGVNRSGSEYACAGDDGAGGHG
jgi:hypothetical protein